MGGEAEALAMAKGLMDKAAPWKAGVKWPVVLVQGIVLGVAGLVIWLAPGFGATAVLQLLAVLLLITSLLSLLRLIQGRVAPGKVGPVAFRAGVGTTVGLLVVIGSLLAERSDTGTVALAIVMGIGLILYGLSELLTAFFRREPGTRFPVVAVLVSVATVIVGLLLVLNGRSGITSLTSTFTILGILLVIAGLAIIGYSLMLRQANQAEPAD
jgi:uncharacterized membrane protein HdeD (DUF308 family)